MIVSPNTRASDGDGSDKMGVRAMTQALAGKNDLTDSSLDCGLTLSTIPTLAGSGAPFSATPHLGWLHTFTASQPNSSGFTNVTPVYQTYNLPLYSSSGPAITDINQGNMGDCYFLASLGGLALENQSFLKSLITSQGNGNYGVTFYVNGKATVVTVDSSLPTIHASNTAQMVNGSVVSGQQLLGNDAYANITSLWANLMEKAFATLNGNSYANIGNGGSIDAALKELTNGTITDYSGAAITTNKQTIINALASHQIVVLGSMTNTSDTTGYDGATKGYQDLVSSHAMTITGYDSATGDLIVRNPWGTASSLWSAKFNTSFEVSFSQLASINGDTLSVDTITGPAPAPAPAPSVAPISVLQTANQTASAGKAWSFSLPANAFVDNVGATITTSAYQTAGPSITSWMTYNAKTETLAGTAPKAFSGTVTLDIKATDTAGNHADDIFTVTFNKTGADVHLVGVAAAQDINTMTLLS